MAADNQPQEPPPYIELRAAGSMVCDVAAHTMGLRGGAYRYGATKVGGIKNMLSNGEVLRSITFTETPIVTGISGNVVSLILGGNNFDQIQNIKHVQVITSARGVRSDRPGFAGLDVNGEIAFQATTGAGTSYGAFMEPFIMGGKTVTVTNASNAITFSASVAALTLYGQTGAGYLADFGYSPNYNAPRRGDLLEVIQGGVASYYRLADFSSGTAWTIFPAWQGTNAAGLTCTIFRTGYGSYSRALWIQTAGGTMLYYCGNLAINESLTAAAAPAEFGWGTLECIPNWSAHRMSPNLYPSGNPLYAVDAIYFKNYLLYGYGQIIGWSNDSTPFGSGGATGFVNQDFPDINRNAGFLQDKFVGFELIGDQCIAVFEENAYLVQATGQIPAFEFHRLPQFPGAYNKGIQDPTIPLHVGHCRPLTSSGTSLFFVSRQGVMEMRGAPPANEIGQPINSYEHVTTDDTYDLTFDPSSDSVSVFEGHARGLIYRRGDWFELDITGEGICRGVAGNNYAASSWAANYRPFGYGFWRASDQKLYLMNTSQNLEVGPISGQSPCPWTWASPLVDLTRIYDGWKLGGFEILARAPLTLSAPITMNWTIWGGMDPYNVTAKQSGAFDYKTGHKFGARSRLGGKFEFPYFGIVLSGTYWAELYGVRCYPIDTTAAR